MRRSARRIVSSFNPPGCAFRRSKNPAYIGLRASRRFLSFLSNAESTHSFVFLSNATSRQGLFSFCIFLRNVPLDPRFVSGAHLFLKPTSAESGSQNAPPTNYYTRRHLSIDVPISSSSSSAMQSPAILHHSYPKVTTASFRFRRPSPFPRSPRKRGACEPSLGRVVSLALKDLRVAAVGNKSSPPSLDPDPQDPDLDEDRYDNKKEGGDGLGWLPVFPHVLTASMANFLFGYHIGVMNGPIEAVAGELGFEGNSFLEGLVVSIFIVGAFFGSLSSASLIDKFGCQRTLQIDTIPLVFGALLSAQAHSLDEMLWGRFLVGLGIGVNTVLVPLYISEVSPTKYRGSLGTLCQIGTCLGIIASLSLGIPSDSDPHWWRTMLLIACVPGVIIMFGMQFAVESPRWLCKVGRFDDARKIIEKLWGRSEIEKSIEEIESVVKNDGEKTRWSEIFVEPHNRVAFIGGSLFFLQQFAGINGVLYFSSLTFQDVGITNGSLATLFVGITNLGGALVASYLMDKQGRKRLLIGSYLGMACSMFLIVCAISFPLDEGSSHSLSIIGTLMYIFTFAIGAGPVTGIIIPELSSALTRPKIMGFSFAIHWICNFLVGLFFLELVDKFGVGAVYATFGGFSLSSAVFAMYYIVETKGRSLEEIEMSLNSSFPTESK